MQLLSPPSTADALPLPVRLLVFNCNAPPHTSSASFPSNQTLQDRHQGTLKGREGLKKKKKKSEKSFPKCRRRDCARVDSQICSFLHNPDWMLLSTPALSPRHSRIFKALYKSWVSQVWQHLRGVQLLCRGGGKKEA